MSIGPTHRFSYTPDPDNGFDHIIATIETHSENIDNVLCAMEAYLKASGFCMNGRKLEIVDDTPSFPGEPQPSPTTVRIGDADVPF